MTDATTQPKGNTMTNIQKTISEYLRGAVSEYTMRCFVGMIETGEAVAADFEAVRPGLADAVNAAMNNQRDAAK